MSPLLHPLLWFHCGGYLNVLLLYKTHTWVVATLEIVENNNWGYYNHLYFINSLNIHYAFVKDSPQCIYWKSEALRGEWLSQFTNRRGRTLGSKCYVERIPKCFFLFLPLVKSLVFKHLRTRLNIKIITSFNGLESSFITPVSS